MDYAVNAFIEKIPSVKHKVLIDAVNCLDVANDHVRALRGQEYSFFSRCFGALSGGTQHSVNLTMQNHGDAIAAVTQLVETLCMDQVHCNGAVQQVAQRLSVIEASVGKLAHKLVEVKQGLESLRTKLDGELQRFQQEIDGVHLRIDAQRHLEQTMARWSDGVYDPFPIGSKIYIALHDLRWGKFGVYYHSQAPQEYRNELMQALKEALMRRLKDELADHSVRPLSHWTTWLGQGGVPPTLFDDGLRYLEVGTDVERRPWSMVMTHLPVDKLPASVSLFFGADLVVSRMLRETFVAKL